MATTEAGKCTRTFILREALLPLACCCDSGVFTLEDGSLPEDTHCTKCGHTITDHGGCSPGFWRLYLNTTNRLIEVLKSPFPLLALDPQLELRSKTCETLFSRLCSERVVHARGTPTSGKSSLGKVSPTTSTTGTKSTRRWHAISWQNHCLVERPASNGFKDAC